MVHILIMVLRANWDYNKYFKYISCFFYLQSQNDTSAECILQSTERYQQTKVLKTTVVIGRIIQRKKKEFEQKQNKNIIKRYEAAYRSMYTF